MALRSSTKSVEIAEQRAAQADNTVERFFGPVTQKHKRVALQEFKRMIAEGKAVTPKAVLEEARNPESKLHDLFEWNDKKVADKYRLHWAGVLLRSVTVLHVEHKEPVRAMLPVLRVVNQSPVPQTTWVMRQNIERNFVDGVEVAERYLKQIKGLANAVKDLGVQKYSKSWRNLLAAIDGFERDYEQP